VLTYRVLRMDDAHHFVNIVGSNPNFHI